METVTEEAPFPSVLYLFLFAGFEVDVGWICGRESDSQNLNLSLRFLRGLVMRKPVFPV